MDALERVAAVALPLLRDVDDALATLGAPAQHPVWGLLRRLRATPADAVAFFVNLQPDRLRRAGAAMHGQADAFEALMVPATLRWEGSAAHSYAAWTDALNHHLHGDGAESMAGRLRSSASYVDVVADWCQQSRDRFAIMLGTVLVSSQTVTLRSVPGLGRGLAEVLTTVSSGSVERAVLAAADIGAAVLGVAEEAVVEGRNLHRGAASELVELPFREPAPVDPAHQGTIRLHQ